MPIRDAELIGDKEIRVPVRKEQVKEAPEVDPDGELSPEEERRLYEHYGRSDYGEWHGEDQTTSLDLPAEPSQGRSARPGDDGDAGDDAPVMVGVRLRRVVVIVPEDDTP